MIRISRSLVDDIVAHARESAPNECCGLVGGSADGVVQTIYRCRNVAPDRLVTYEAAPEDLFDAQRKMRKRGEQLIAIYHSHPRAAIPEPSPTDVRLAYYPSAVYLILGFAGQTPCLQAFRISESEGCWEPAEIQIVS